MVLVGGLMGIVLVGGLMDRDEATPSSEVALWSKKSFSREISSSSEYWWGFLSEVMAATMEVVVWVPSVSFGHQNRRSY